MRRVMNVVLMSLVLMGMGSAPSALMVGSQEVRIGAQGVHVPLTLRIAKSAQMTGLQAELRYDPNRLHLQSTIPGPALSAAGKQLSTNVHEPGVVKILLFGMNRRPLENGLIALLVFDVSADQSPGPLTVQISRVSATDVKAQAVSLQGVSGRLTTHR